MDMSRINNAIDTINELQQQLLDCIEIVSGNQDRINAIIKTICDGCGKCPTETVDSIGE